jgi:hypothetical protein
MLTQDIAFNDFAGDQNNYVSVNQTHTNIQGVQKQVLKFLCTGIGIYQELILWHFLPMELCSPLVRKKTAQFACGVPNQPLKS